MKLRWQITWVIMVVLVILFYSPGVANAKQIRENGVLLEIESTKAQGKVQLAGKTEKEKIKIMVDKDNKQTWYDIKPVNGMFLEEIWLTQGKGTYTVAVMVHEYDRKYSYGPQVVVENTEIVNKFLVPTKHIESNNDKIIELAKEITKNKESHRDKAKAFYDWVTSNIRYDFEKYGKHRNADYDNEYGAVHTLEIRQGVCYDFAALTAALGRAAGLQVKVVKGEGISGEFRGLHAWNEIYIVEDKQWINVDTTFGALTGNDFFDNANFSESHVKASEY
ncbi:MAG: transglutaminase family protein [Bacillota bacterium]